MIPKQLDSIHDYLDCQLTRNPTRLRTNLKLTAAYVSKYLRVTRTSLNTMPNTFQLLKIAACLLIHIDLFRSFVCRRTAVSRPRIVSYPLYKSLVLSTIPKVVVMSVQAHLPKHKSFIKVFRELSQTNASTNVRIQQPKYFEQTVSDYSDVVPVLQKVYQDTEHTDFL